MSVRIVLTCPHCRSPIEVPIGAPVSHTKTESPELPAPSVKGAVCACGHERGWHESGSGKCTYGASTLHGRCECDGYHKRARKTAASASTAPSTLGRCERAILAVMVQRQPNSTSRQQAAVLSGYSIDSGGFAQALAKLRREEMVLGGASAMVATDKGRLHAGNVASLPRGGELLDYWSDRLGPCAGAILQVLATAWPKEVDRHKLAETTGYSAESGGFAQALAKLRTLELISGFRATDALMEAVRG